MSARRFISAVAMLGLFGMGCAVTEEASRWVSHGVPPMRLPPVNDVPVLGFDVCAAFDDEDASQQGELVAVSTDAIYLIPEHETNNLAFVVRLPLDAIEAVEIAPSPGYLVRFEPPSMGGLNEYARFPQGMPASVMVVPETSTNLR